MDKEKLQSVIKAAGDDWGDNTVVQLVGDDWIAVMEWPDGTTDGGPSRLIIKPLDKMPVGGLSSTVLRQIDFRGAIESFRDQIAESARHSQVDPDSVRAFERNQLRSALSEGVTDRYLAMLAFEYVRATERGQSNINDYLAELVGKPVGTVRGHLIRARREELLSGTHGRKGGSLSPEAHDLVEPYALAWLAELDRLSRIEDKPKRRRPQKAITPRTDP